MKWKPAQPSQKVRFGRMRRTIREVGNQGASLRNRYAVFVTLTYRPGEVWHASHIRDCLHRMRMWSQRMGIKIPYCWVLELTKSGTPHYHVILWLPKGVKVPFFDARGWWFVGSSQTERARDPKGRYLAKYVSKNEELIDDDDRDIAFPVGARVFGRGGFTGHVLGELRYWLRPDFVRRRCNPTDTVRKVEGGWLIVDTGEMIHSPYRVHFDGPRMYVLHTKLGFPKGRDDMQIKARVREVREVKRGDEVRSVVTLETTHPLEMFEANIEAGMVHEARSLVDSEFVTVDVRLRGYRDRVFLNADRFHLANKKAG